jgi:hypothetical protein
MDQIERRPKLLLAQKVPQKSRVLSSNRLGTETAQNQSLTLSVGIIQVFKNREIFMNFQGKMVAHMSSAAESPIFFCGHLFS